MGSGSASGEHYEKRQKIRKALEEHFSKSEVRFSEDLTHLIPSAGDVGIGQQEDYQLALSDACVVLDRPRAQKRRLRTSLAAR